MSGARAKTPKPVTVASTGLAHSWIPIPAKYPGSVRLDEDPREVTLPVPCRAMLVMLIALASVGCASNGPASPIPGPVAGTATTLADGRVLIAGGYGGPGPSDKGTPSTAAAVLYDPVTNTFKPTGSMTVAREGHTATLLDDGRVLITGGGNDTNGTPTDLDSAELYDPQTGTFSLTSSLVAPNTGGIASALKTGDVLIVDSHNGSADVYDPGSGTFRATGPMAAAHRRGQATLLLDGRVLVVGGSDDSLAALASAEIYDPSTGTFRPTASMAAARSYCTATQLSDGRVLVVGGEVGTSHLATSELYDPKSGTFSPGGLLTEPRSMQAAVRLFDGRVLVLGGTGSGERPLTSAEVYDPKTSTFSRTGSMSSARYLPMVALLKDGRVFVAGGQSIPEIVHPTAEIYDPATGKFSPAG